MRRSGSSPRGRGTRDMLRENPELNRFIPARAGNAARLPLRRTSWTVHPRAGGERLLATREQQFRDGSSPRGRGTRTPRPGAPRAERFIPARAGNATVIGYTKASLSVHPRAGGERDPASPGKLSGYGSSPRGRGTQTHRMRAAGWDRFIPARAGNARRRRARHNRPSVHPRAGGERAPRQRRRRRGAGSSPRGRGTPHDGEVLVARDRFIPARAGNAIHKALLSGRRTVHPRAGGERPSQRSRR